VAARQYREDLYFRLSVFPIAIPPLRERPNDIPLLARTFVERFCRDLNKPVLALAPSALDEMLAHSWRGNVRELQNCIERAVILTEGDTIHARHLNLRETAAPDAPDGRAEESPWTQIDLSGSMADATKRVLAEVERLKITQAMTQASGHPSIAAEILQMGFKTLQAKLKEHGIS
jgi:DNA-binding NtrC family response regulator